MNKIIPIFAISLILSIGVPAAFADTLVIPVGFDLFNVDSAGINEIHLDLPAGYFGSIGGTQSEAFAGVVPLTGQLPPTSGIPRSAFVLDPFQLTDNSPSPRPDAFGLKFALKDHPRAGQQEPDTVIQRLDEIVLPNIGDTQMVQTEMVSLSLVSADPIQVSYGSVGDQFFDVFVELDPSPSPTGHRGFYIIDRSIPTGGTEGGTTSTITFTGLELHVRFENIENPTGPQADHIPYLGDVILEIPVDYTYGEIIGGEIIPIQTTSLLLAGAQSSMIWILPVILIGVGFAAYKLRIQNKIN